jgi:hypothetical protein
VKTTVDHGIGVRRTYRLQPTTVPNDGSAVYLCPTARKIQPFALLFVLFAPETQEIPPIIHTGEKCRLVPAKFCGLYVALELCNSGKKRFSCRDILVS